MTSYDLIAELQTAFGPNSAVFEAWSNTRLTHYFLRSGQTLREFAEFQLTMEHEMACRLGIDQDAVGENELAEMDDRVMKWLAQRAPKHQVIDRAFARQITEAHVRNALEGTSRARCMDDTRDREETITDIVQRVSVLIHDLFDQHEASK